MSPEQLRDEIDKRFTMNWLIQGASQHVGMTLHHLIREELAAIDPKLPQLYDQAALMGQLQWWRILPAALFGWPPLWWRSARRSRSHPFFRHPLLAKYGGELAEATRKRAVQRAKVKGVLRWPLTFTVQMAIVSAQIRRREIKSRTAVTQAACHAASLAWGIDQSRFWPQLTFAIGAIPPFATLRPTKSIRGIIFLSGIVGWGGVIRDHNGTPSVYAVGKSGYYLTKELVKGTAELICLHGLSRLDEETYSEVMRMTDRVELEPAMLNSGSELWRRLLLAIPSTLRPADVLMQLARAGARTVHTILADAIEGSPRATSSIRALCEDLTDDQN